MAAPNISPAGQALLLGTSGPLLSPAGVVAAAALAAVSEAGSASTFPQTTRWDSIQLRGTLHPLDYITINGVVLPLAEMPSGEGLELDYSRRKAPGQDFAGHVSHGHKQHPTKIKLLLFRDLSLGWRNGEPVGKDWLREYERIEKALIAKRLSRRDAVPVSYPTLHALGIDSLLFVKVHPIRRSHGQFFHADLEGIDPRTVKDGASKPVPPGRQDLSTRANPAPQNASPAQGAGSASRGTAGTGNGPASRRAGR